ncbi:FKBP prolyl isomerase 16 isoform X2 [Sphaeramia orbicularis]|uniref:FKBP prolyl isomerase 16 isoform X2 n=1 Tax=Sphaeramia orbicularis TaxID=375764 RepID=UPI0011810DE1|nr:peptidyl-prolyl cis-trans isomerase FKBP8-like isoform X2 [Sphaeramia orbicularis]
MQMVSIALLSDMESKPYCEENTDTAVESTEVKEAMSELPDRDSPTEQSAEEQEELSKSGQPETESITGENKSSEIKSSCDPECNDTETECKPERKLRKTNSWKMVRFQDPSEEDDVSERDSSVECLFPQYVMQEWTSLTFEELFMAEDWQDITEDRLLRKKVLEPGPPLALRPTWGQEVMVKMQSVLEDRTVVEKDCKLVFVIGEGDVTQALEECVLSMQRGEITLLLADSQYAYGLLGREPDIPAWAPLLSQLQLLDIRDKPDPLTLPIADRIRIGNQKRERGNFHFQREEYSMAARSYSMSLDMLTTCSTDGGSSGVAAEEEEMREYRVKCLNNLATAQLKLEQTDDALHTSRDVLTLEPNNVKALFRMGKLLSDKGEYKEAMEVLKKALKLEPTTKAIHIELSKLVKRQSGGQATQEWKAKPADMFGDNITPFLLPSKKKSSGISWKLLLGALVVALGSLVTSVILTARN